jgi:membrane-bound lytic murein transglycosylase D
VIQEIDNLVEMAHQSLQINDSLGALAFYENAITLFTSLPDNQRSQLLKDSSFTKYYENQVRAPYARISEKLQFFLEDTTSTDEVQSDLNAYFKAQNISKDTIQITEEEEFKIPHVMNKKVKLAIKYFTQTPRGRRVMERWLKRSGKYEKLIKSILREEGVPEDLFYLAMIESGLNPRARSYARAVGIWQFIKSTGRAYGLRSNFWFDERRDVVKATRAAAKHLKSLYKDFGDWYLALAGYNYSPRKLKRKMRYYNASEFWDIRRLPRQTRNYVPTFLAARYIAKHMQEFGFFVEKDPPVQFDTVHVSEAIDLTLVAEMVDTTYRAIRDLNPAVLRWVTPPDVKDWVLYLPKGTKEIFKEKYKQIPESKKRYYIRHRVRYGETLSHISYKYGIPIWLIKRTNHLRSNLIRVGQNLILPVPKNRKAYYSIKPGRKKYARGRKKLPMVKGKTKIVYRVKEGDNLYDISRAYGVTISKLKYWNGLYRNRIYPGQKLNIWVSPDFAQIKKPIDNEHQALALANEGVNTSNGEKIIHVVKRGDTLWDIARKYNTSIRAIKKWNNMRSNKIRPGEKLIIYR